MRSNRISVEIDAPITPDPSDSEGLGSDDDDSTSSSHEEYSPKTAASNRSRDSKKSGGRKTPKKFIRYNSSSDSEDEGDKEPLLVPVTSLSPQRPLTQREAELDLQFDILLASPSRYVVE